MVILKDAAGESGERTNKFFLFSEFLFFRVFFYFFYYFFLFFKFFRCPVFLIKLGHNVNDKFYFLLRYISCFIKESSISNGWGVIKKTRLNIEKRKNTYIFLFSIFFDLWPTVWELFLIKVTGAKRFNTIGIPVDSCFNPNLGALTPIHDS